MTIKVHMVVLTLFKTDDPPNILVSCKIWCVEGQSYEFIKTSKLQNTSKELCAEVTFERNNDFKSKDGFIP